MTAPGSRQPPTAPPPTGPSVRPHSTCLGCGCCCDDIEVAVAEGRIVEARRACPIGVRWFGDGSAPALATVGGRTASQDEALDAAAALVAGAARPLVFLAPELSCEAQREAIAIADLLRGALDGVTSATSLAGVLAAQERGRAGATLGEIRNRADVVLFWGVDPAVRYPRFEERYAPTPVGTHVPGGRAGRTVIAVDVGRDSRGPADADLRVAVAPEDEASTLAALVALLREAPAAGAATAATSAAPSTLPSEGAMWESARAIAAPLLAGRYVALVSDGEPAPGRDADRAGLLVSLGQALNGPTRAAHVVLRAGGNRNGADSVTTSQTGYPLAVEFARGYPRYRPYDGTALALLARGAVDVALVVGALDGGRVPHDLVSALRGARCVVVGPRASAAPVSAAVAIDGAVAGIHEAGTALRTDDVPLPLRALIDGPPATAALVRALGERVRWGIRGVERAGANARPVERAPARAAER